MRTNVGEHLESDSEYVNIFLNTMENWLKKKFAKIKQI
jgi:hypothetical protein